MRTASRTDAGRIVGRICWPLAVSTNIFGLGLALALALGLVLTLAFAFASPAPANGTAAVPETWRYSALWPLPPLPIEPIDVAWLRVDGAAPKVVVADGRNRRVLVVDARSGETESAWPPPARIAELSPLGGRPTVVFPLAVAADGDRARIYVLWAEIGWDDPRFRGFSPLYIETRSAGGAYLGVARKQPGFLLDGRLGAIVDLSVNPADGALLASVGGHIDRLNPTTGATKSVGRLGREDELARFAAMPDGSIALASPTAGLVVIFDSDGEITARIDLFGERLAPVAVASDSVGRLLVMVRPEFDPESDDDPPIAGPHDPLLLVFDASFSRTATRSAFQLGVPPPRGLWPWSIDIDRLGADAGLTFVTTGERLEVRAFESLDKPAGMIEGETAGDVPAWLPNLDIDGTGFGEGIALHAGGTDEVHLTAVDNRDGIVAAFNADGVLGASRPIPPGVIDIATDGTGAMFTSAENGRIRRYDGPPYIPDEPTWSVEQSLALGGRLALVGPSLWVSQPKERSLLRLRIADGMAGPLDRITLPDSIGLWPTDVARAPDGSLLAADLVAGEVSRWNVASGLKVDNVAVGLIAGPYRIAATKLESGDDLLVALTADGALEAHTLLVRGANLIARWMPRGVDGALISPDDIAVDSEGRIYLSDRSAAAVHVLEPGIDPAAPSATPTPIASPTPSSRACIVTGDKIAEPSTVVLGEAVTVTLTLAANCPGRTGHSGADIVLALDRSGSMEGAKLDSAREAAASLAALLDVRFHRIGLVSFASEAALDAPLSHDVLGSLDGLDRLSAEGGTNLASAVAMAADHLNSVGRSDALPVIILLTDGRHTDGEGDPLGEAARARAAGIRIHTIGLGFDVDADTLRTMAASDARFHPAPRPGDLFPIYADILREVVSSLAGRLEIQDEMGPEVTYLTGSADPPAIESAELLRWGRSFLPADGITLTYRVRPDRLGRLPTNRSAFADYDDGDGLRRRFDFPIPEVVVIAPSPTPTGTQTPTPTPAPTPAPLHLPFVVKQACFSGLRRADIVLVIDTSSSMAGEKLAQAREAARTFVSRLDLPRDQAAIVGFDSVAVITSGLSGNAVSIQAAIDDLVSGTGTRIDRALRTAAGVIAGDPARNPRNRPVIILLTDGAHGGDRDEVIALARTIKAGGVTLHTIGLGGDADLALLTAIASPGSFHLAPSPEDLGAIYARLAGSIPCR